MPGARRPTLVPDYTHPVATPDPFCTPQDHGTTPCEHKQTEQTRFAPATLLNHLLHCWRGISLILVRLKPETRRAAAAAACLTRAASRTEGIRSPGADNYLPAGFGAARTSLALHIINGTSRS